MRLPGIALRGIATLLALGVVASATLAQESVTQRVRAEISLPRVERAPALEEFLDMRPPPDLAASMALVEGFTQREPEDGQPASQHTEVFLGYDDEHLYAIFIAFDDDPKKIRAHLARRGNVFPDDIVEIQLDTFNDERRAFTFICNPFGIQWDAIYTEDRGFDDSWDTVWYSEGRLTDRGYVVMMRIPFKSLRFKPKPDQTWGLVLLREIPRNNENSFWPQVTQRIAGRLNQGATLNGLRDISPGRNIWFTPYATARNFRVVDESQPDGFDQSSADAEVGGDLKMIIKDALTLDVTLNPDFSQVESDRPQVTVNQRFEVFFPERRPFFVENASIFESPINLLFTRRIADPRLGARLTGKVGGWGIGALLIDDRAPGQLVEPGDPGEGERAALGVLRVTRDIGEQSNVGVMYNDWSFDNSYNRVGSLTGRFRLDTNWFTRFQAAYSSSSTLDGAEASDEAYSLEFNRQGRVTEAHIHYLEVGPGFVSETGFVPRTDVRNMHASGEYKFWPEGERLISWGPELRVERITDHSGLRLDESVSPGIEFEFRRQTSLDLSFSSAQVRLRPTDFPELTAPQDYSTDSVRLSFSSRFSDPVNLSGSYAIAEAINFSPPKASPPTPADRAGGELGLTLRLGRRFRLENDYLFTTLDEPSGGNIFTNHIVRTRFDWTYNARLSVRLIVRYEELDADPDRSSLESTEAVNGDFLISYIVNPWTAFYVGYNSNYQNLALVDQSDFFETRRTDGQFLNDARQLFVKVSYLFQF